MIDFRLPKPSIDRRRRPTIRIKSTRPDGEPNSVYWICDRCYYTNVDLPGSVYHWYANVDECAADANAHALEVHGERLQLLKGESR